MFKFIWMLILSVPLRFYFRARAVGLENIPKNGSCLILSNHVSLIDPPAIGIMVYFRKKTRFMARDTLFGNVFLKYFLEHVGALPLNRGAGFRGGFERAFEALKKEELALVAFPEGTRSRDGKLKEGKPGIGLFVLHANLPVVPCYISGAYEAMPKGRLLPLPKKIVFTFGEPFTVLPVTGREPTKEDYKRVTVEIMNKIAALGGVPSPDKKSA